MRRRGIPGWGNFTKKDLQGGGPLIDIGAHILDLAAYLMDYPAIDYVCATASDRIGKKGGTGLMGSWNGERYEVEDGLFGFIKFANGSSLHVRTSFAVHIAEKEKRNLRLYGDKMGLSVFPMELYGDEMGHQENKSYPFDEVRDWHYDCIKNFAESCMGNARILVTAQQAVYVQRLITGLYRSAEMGNRLYMGIENSATAIWVSGLRLRQNRRRNPELPFLESERVHVSELSEHRGCTENCRWDYEDNSL